MHTEFYAVIRNALMYLEGMVAQRVYSDRLAMISGGFDFRSFASCSHLCASVAKQYHSVPMYKPEKIITDYEKMYNLPPQH